MLTSADTSFMWFHWFWKRDSARSNLISSMPCTDSTNKALRIEDSRIPICASLANGFCAKIPGIIIKGTTNSITQNRLPPINQKMNRNKKKNGKSAIAVTVVEVTISRTPSNSRICEIKVPVDFERSLFLILNA